MHHGTSMLDAAIQGGALAAIMWLVGYALRALKKKTDKRNPK